MAVSKPLISKWSCSWMPFFYYKLAPCHVCMHAQSCPTLCDPMDSSPPCSSVHEFSRQEYWSGLPYPSPGDFADPRIKPVCLASSALAGGLFTNWATREALEVLKSSKSNPCLHPMKVTCLLSYLSVHTLRQWIQVLPLSIVLWMGFH